MGRVMKVSIIAVATMSAIVLVVLLTHHDSDAVEAPSYDEINKAMQAIIYTDARPNGPSVGPDGITDQEFLQEWLAYNATLKSKKVTGWVGCLTDVEPPLQNVRGDLYNIVMDESKVGKHDAFSDIMLTGMNTLDLLRINLSFPKDTAKVGCWRIRFGGIIQQIQSDGRLFIGQGNAEPIK